MTKDVVQERITTEADGPDTVNERLSTGGPGPEGQPDTVTERLSGSQEPATEPEDESAPDSDEEAPKPKKAVAKKKS